VQYALNPHPSNQLSMNVPQDNDLDAWGLQHKYPETLLVFPASGADLPQLLRLLLPLGAICGSAGAEAGGARAGHDEPLPSISTPRSRTCS